MVIAFAGILGWLLMLTIAVSLGVAAKRGDELGQAARRNLSDSHVGAQIIPFHRPQPRSDLEVAGQR